MAQLSGGQITDFEVSPELAGLPVHPFEAILGGGPADNARALRAMLDGEPSAYRDAVVLNAAAALMVADKAADLAEGAAIAADSIDSGRAKAALEALARVTRG